MLPDQKNKRPGKKGHDVVKKLRLSKLDNGHPFMINTVELPGSQFYLVYLDGTILLSTIDWVNYDYKIIKKITGEEIKALRKRLNLY